LALPGRTIELQTHCGKLYVTVNHDPVTGKPQEVFCRFGKAGGCGSAIMDGLTKVLSAGLRAGLDSEVVMTSLAGIACHHGSRTCMNAVAEALRETKALISPQLP
jgi:hypothetical protein